MKLRRIHGYRWPLWEVERTTGSVTFRARSPREAARKARRHAVALDPCRCGHARFEHIRTCEGEGDTCTCGSFVLDDGLAVFEETRAARQRANRAVLGSDFP